MIETYSAGDDAGQSTHADLQGMQASYGLSRDTP